MRVNWQKEEEGGKRDYKLPPEGKYSIKVEDPEERTSEKGDPYFNVRLVGREEAGEWAGKTVSFDIIMGDGPGAGIGRAKLKGLGFDLESGDSIEARDLHDRYATAYIKHEPYKGKMRTKVDIDQGEHCGYDCDIPF